MLAEIRGARLVTVTGPGGSGKTRLAIEAAATLVPSYKAGVFWVGLATLRDPALVSETIAQTLGAKDGLAEHIGERELLLLLDNLEQVIEAAPQLSALLSACPNLNVLVTSRELLRVQGEVEYEAPPLASPEAVALFCERSRLEPSEEIAEVCIRLDELPLAVELAAARAKALSPKQILERLSQRLDLLEGGRDADPRQQTLRATIDWSYDLLSEEEQRVLRALSVFAGCTLDAAEEVCGTEINTLQSLVEKSLLRFSSRALLDARDDPRVCARTAGRGRRDRCARPPSRRLPPRAARGATNALSSSVPAVESCWPGSGKRRTTSGQPSTISRALRRRTQHMRLICSRRSGCRAAGSSRHRNACFGSSPGPISPRARAQCCSTTSAIPSCAWNRSKAPRLMRTRLSRSPRNRGSAERSPGPSGPSPKSPSAEATSTKRSASTPA